jgi:aminomethyltransferase
MSQELDDFGFGTQIRKSPFFNSTVRWGAQGFSVYNHMYIPRDFGDPEQNFWNLLNDAILCDVAVERQVQIKGPDASKFVQMMSPRDLSNMQVGQCKYVILTNQFGGVLNDPVLLRVKEDCYWFSLADSDVLFWALGLASNGNYDVEITEPDVSPLQLQGPKSRDIMIKLFGDEIKDLKYYWFKNLKLGDINLLVSRTGWSSELGYEIFLLNTEEGDEVYETIMQAGKGMGLHAGHTSTIRRIEGGMLSYHSDMNIDTNLLELGMDRLVDLDNDFDFIGKKALQKIAKEGVKNMQVGLVIHDDPMPRPNTKYWNIYNNKSMVGQVTSAVYSPRLKKNIALAMVDINSSVIGMKLTVEKDNKVIDAEVVEKPFYDPKKSITKS